MANKKLAPNRGKHSAAKEAVESALQPARSPLLGTRRRAPPFASDAAESMAPSPPKHTVSSPAKDMGPAPAKDTAPSAAKDQAPATSSEAESDDAEDTPPAPASASAKNKAPVPDKNKASASAKNKTPVPDKNKASSSAKNKASASAKNKAPVPDKNKASPSAKNDVPAAPDEDEVAAPPQDTTLMRFINFLCEKAASLPWRGLLDAFLTWVHSSAGGEAQAEAPTEDSAHQKQREKKYLEEAKNTQHQAAPQLSEERRRRNYAYKYGKDARRRKKRECDKIEADRSVPTDLSTSQNGRDFDEAEADRIIPAGPSISKIVEDYQKFDRYLSSDIHKDYIKIMSSCPPGIEVCTFCYFEKDNKARRSQSHRIVHIRDWHDSLAGVKCTNCPVRFPTEHVRDLHGLHCNA